MSQSDASPPSLYAAREPVFPKSVRGPFRRLKWIVMAVTLGIYYVTPWIRWDRGPHLPDQAVLIDLANRRFFFFWIEIWPHEFYYIAGLLIMAGIGLFLFTSVLGRVWCGYSCPQTVWVDLYLHVERLIDGDRNNQIRLHRRKWDAHKISRRMLKWAIWLLIAVATGGAWVFYFADAPTLFVDIFTGEASSIAYTTIGVLTATTFVLGGFMREQVCIYMCPWPRIQAAMLDENSLTVTYKYWRGEPRGRHRKRAAAARVAAEAAEQVLGYRAPTIALPGRPVRETGVTTVTRQPGELGDCIDCNACVNVCPMGIDIRDGQQLGCITCALCIDACDEMMAKVGKPRGLIDYCTLADERREAAGETPLPVWKRILRPRVFIYTALWAGIGVAMIVALFMRSSIDMTVRPERNPVYVLLSDGSVRNSYEVGIENQQGEPHRFRLGLRVENAQLDFDIQDVEGDVVEVPADATRKFTVFVTRPNRVKTPQRLAIELWATDLTTRERASYETYFQGPEE